MVAHDRAGGAGVVEVDVREQEVTQVGETDAALCEPGFERLACRGRPAVEEGEAVVGLDQVDPDRALAAGEVQVDRLHRVVLKLALRPDA